MTYYYPGYSEDREKVLKMDDDQLFSLMDALFGRDNLPENPTHEQILNEALAQHKREWTDETSEEFERVQFYTNLYKAMSHERANYR